MDKQDAEEISTKRSPLLQTFAETAKFSQKELSLLTVKDCAEEFRVMSEWQANPNKVIANKKQKNNF